MLIILEGPDGAGKTTLAQSLCDEVSRHGDEVTLLHKGPLTRHPLLEYELDLADYRPNSGSHIICDRWHIGELVYGPILRGRSRLDRAQYLHVELVLECLGAVQVHVGATVEELCERVASRGDDLITPDLVRRISDEYVKHFAFNPPCITTRVDTITATDLLTHAALHDEHRQHLVDVSPTYVGCPAPEMLFLGDRRHQPDTSFPWAFVPMEATSGHWLCKLFDSWSALTTSRFGVMNACEDDESLLRSWSALGEPDVVTLGKNAHAACDKVGIVHGAAPHPQYMRRFHHHAWHEYLHILTRAYGFREDHSSWRP